LRRFHAENGMGRLDIEKLEAIVLQQMSRDLVFVSEKDGALIGAMGLVEEEWFYSRDTYLHDFFLYIVPEERNNGHLAEFTAMVAGLAEGFGIPGYWIVLNFKRAFGRVASIYGHVPAGYIARIG
jgi:hypothetical protein